MKIALAVVLVTANLFVQVLIYPGETGLANFLGFLIGMTLVGPALLALPFCLTPARRTWGHFLTGFNILSFLLVAGGAIQALKLVTAADQTVTTPDGTVSLRVPASWKTPASTNPEVDLVITDKMGVVSVFVTAVPKDPAAPMHLHDIAAGAASVFPADKVKATRGPFPCPPSDLPCTYHEIELGLGQDGVVAIVAFAETPAAFYNVTTASASALYPSEKARLLKILASLAPTERTPRP